VLFELLTRVVNGESYTERSISEREREREKERRLILHRTRCSSRHSRTCPRVMGLKPIPPCSRTKYSGRSRLCHPLKASRGRPMCSGERSPRQFPANGTAATWKGDASCTTYIRTCNIPDGRRRADKVVFKAPPYGTQFAPESITRGYRTSDNQSFPPSLSHSLSLSLPLSFSFTVSLV